MARVFIAGPQFTPQERQALQGVESLVRSLGHQAFLPASETAAGPEGARQALLFHVRGLDSCDATIVALDGHPVDAATALLVGYAHATRRPVLGLRSDARRDGAHQGLPPLLRGALQEAVLVTDWTPESMTAPVRSFLAGVRVFAGTLVRDAVPRQLETEGRPLTFRNVSPEEYPAVLKRKLVETARRLEETEFGVEQEEIADVLELLETLINLRKYDKESLRSIKEGKWRKRGGFERGFLLDEEPLLSSK